MRLLPALVLVSVLTAACIPPAVAPTVAPTSPPLAQATLPAKPTPAAAPTVPPTAPAKAEPAGDPGRGRRLLVERGCIACHIVKGVEGAVGQVGPELSNIGDTTARPQIAGVLENTPGNLRRWLANPQAVKPGTAMPNLGLTEAEVNDLVAFLTTLR